MAEPQAEPQAETPTVPTTPQSQSRASIRYPSPPPLHAPSGPSRSHKSGRAGGRSPGGCLHPRCCARDASAWRSMHFLEMWLAQATRVWHPSTPGHACSGHLIQPSSLSLSLSALCRPPIAPPHPRLQEFDTELEAEVIDLKRIRKLCHAGIPDKAGIRSVYWKVRSGSPARFGRGSSRPAVPAAERAAPPHRARAAGPRRCPSLASVFQRLIMCVCVCARASPASPLRPAPVLGLGFERRFY